MFVSRGVLILDEDLVGLKKPLEERNFRVHVAVASAMDDQIWAMLMHRVLVTNNSSHLLEPAVVHEFSIIDTMEAPKDPEKLADIISREWLSGSLRNRQPFLARINQDGSVAVSEIEG